MFQKNQSHKKHWSFDYHEYKKGTKSETKRHPKKNTELRSVNETH